MLPHKRPATSRLPDSKSDSAVRSLHFVGDAGSSPAIMVGEDGTPNAKVQHRLLKLASEIFDDWQRILSTSLRKDGISAARARRLAALVVSSVEGTVPLCRATRSAQPLHDVQQELELALSNAIAATKSPEQL